MNKITIRKSSMAIYESFTDWILNENVSAAKIYMQKRYAAAHKKEASNLTPDEKEEALKNIQYTRILELLKSHPGYALPFVKFHFEQGVPIVSQNGDADNEAVLSLSQLLDVIKTKKYIIQQLSKPIEKWASTEPVDGISGFEQLTDEIRTIEREKNAKWFIDDLPRTLREQYRKLEGEEKSRIITLAIQLKELGIPAINRFFSKIKSMESWKIGKVTNYLSSYIGGFSNLSMQKKIKELEELEPEAGILYSDDQYLVMSMRTEKAQKALCSVANWCINKGSFHTYADKGLQINIFNFGIDPSDLLFLTGTTISFEGKVTTSHNIKDDYILKSSDPATHFTELGYPRSLVDTVTDSLPDEFAIKKALSSLYSQRLTPMETITSMTSMRRGALAGKITESVWNNIAGVVAQIVFEEKGFTQEMFMKIYKQRGLFTESGWTVFDAIIGKDYTQGDMEEIKETTDNILDNMKSLIDDVDEGQLTETQAGGAKDVAAMREIIAAEPENEERFKKRITG